MIHSIPISEDEALVIRTKNFYAFQEKIEKNVRDCAKSLDIKVYFCDNDVDLANISLEDLVIAQLSGTAKVR